jgi:hypothetical protein
MMKMFPDQTDQTDTVERGAVAGARGRHPAILQEEGGWLDSKQQQQPPDAPAETHALSLITDEHENTSKCVASASASAPPSIPHFSIICSSTVQAQSLLLLSKCEKLGLFSATRGSWEVIGDVVGTSSSSSTSSPTAAASMMSECVPVPAEITAHIVLLNSEKCTQSAKMSATSISNGAIYQCRRTKTFLKGICMGYWIIDGPRWLRACVTEGKVVALSKFEVSMCEGGSLSAAPSRARLAPRNMLDPRRSMLFDQCTFLLKNLESSSRQLHAGSLRRQDVLFMIHYCGGKSCAFPENAESSYLCDSCHFHQPDTTDNYIENSIMVINFKPGASESAVGKKRKHDTTGLVSTSAHGGGGRCCVCCKAAAGSPCRLLPFPEVGFTWLLDSISSYEKKPFDDYL